jgi:two-component system, NarL family, nitrate/nitrite response regulator NarL
MTARPGSGGTSVLPVRTLRTTSEPIRVLVCVAHPHLLWGLRKLVEGEWPRMLLVATASNLADAEGYLRSHPTEVALLDLPEVSATALSGVERLCRSFTTALVLLDGHQAVLNRLIGAGVKAVLPLDTPADEILGAVYQAVGASAHIEPLPLALRGVAAER